MRPLAALIWSFVVAAPALAQLSGTIQQRSFTGPITGQPVQFNIYLPPGYATSADRYPVIYHLHGLGGSQASHNIAVPASFEAGLAAGAIGPVIIVFPNGYTDAWWADSISGHKPAETDVVDQLIPYVDANFRTIATPGARIVQGFSMGGFGTAKFYSKFPALFAACVEYDGAFLTWQNMVLFQPSSASSIFGNSQSYFDQFSPWQWTQQNASTLADGPPMRMVVGLLVPSNRAFRDHLLGLSIPVDYVEAPCAHSLECLLSTQGQNSVAFIAEALDLTCAAAIACYANCDCSDSPVLSVADFGCFQTKFVSGDPYADCNEDSVLTVSDFGCFQSRFAAGCR